MGIIPVILLALLSLKINVLTSRYVMNTAPIYTILLAGTITNLYYSKILYRYLSILLLAIWISIVCIGLNHYYFHSIKTPDWLALMNYLNKNTNEEDMVIQAAADAAFDFYYDNVKHINVDKISLPATPQQNSQDIYHKLITARNQYNSIWLTAQGFTDWPNYGVTENWLDNHMQRVIDTNINGLRIQQYKTWEVTNEEIRTDYLAINFGHIATLVNIKAITEVQPTGELTLWTYWEAANQTITPLKIFTHLVKDDTIVTQDDHNPQRGHIQTVNWRVNNIYRDVTYLAYANMLTPDTYQLHIGMYNPITGKRVTVLGENRNYITVTLIKNNDGNFTLIKG